MSTFFELENLQHVYQQHPDSLVFAHLAAALLHKSEYQEALKIAEAGIQKFPTYPFGHFVTGLCYYHLNDFLKAKTHLEISLAYDEKNLKAWKLLSVITEKLDLPANSETARLNYYLLDSFNPDAIAVYSQNEESAPGIEVSNPIEAELTPGEDVQLEKFAEVDVVEEADFDELFREAEQGSDEIDFSQKVDEVFKESLGEIGAETDLENQDKDAEPEFSEPLDKTLEDAPSAESSPPAEGAVERAPEPAADEIADPDNPFAGIDMIDVEEETGGEEDAEVDISAELDDFFAEYDDDLEELEAGPEESGDAAESEINFGNIVFDASIEDDADAEANSPPDDLLDFSAIVDEIITDADEAEPSVAEPTDRSSEAVRSDIDAAVEPENASTEETPSPADLFFPEPGQQTAQNPPGETPAESENSQELPELKPGKFGRPPILSPTLGEIYIAQGRFEEALGVFEQLLEKDPENRRFQKKVNDIRNMMAKQKSD